MFHKQPVGWQVSGLQRSQGPVLSRHFGQVKTPLKAFCNFPKAGRSRQKSVGITDRECDPKESSEDVANGRLTTDPHHWLVPGSPVCRGRSRNRF